MENHGTPVGRKSKRTSIVVGAIVLVALLAGAAFVGGRLLNQAVPFGSLVPGGVAAGGKQPIHLEVEPARELPSSAPDASGPFVERKDNRLFIAKNSPPPADGKVQQKVVAGAPDEIGSNSIAPAWGERRGDRLVARVVVYTPAQMIPAANQ